MIKIVTAVTFALLISTISGTSMNAYAGVGGFSGIYAPENWNFVTEGDGLLDDTNAPDSIELTSSDGGCTVFPFGTTQSRDLATTDAHLSGNFFCGTFYEITMFCDGTVNFDWDYESFDIDGPAFDPMGFIVHNDITQLTIGVPFDTTFAIQSGSESVPVEKGDRFGFWIEATDDALGSAVTVFSEFSGPECLVGGEFLPMDNTALLLAGAQTNAVWIISALAVIGSVAFGALYLTTKRN